MIPEYDMDLLPDITKSFTSTQEATKKYLGGRAITGQEYVTINLFGVDNLEVKALYEFWRDDCQYGTLPFLAPLTVNGHEVNRDIPTALCLFIEDFGADKQDIHWTKSLKLKVLEYSENIYTIVDDAGNLMVDDAGLVLASTTAPITNSNKEITHG